VGATLLGQAARALEHAAESAHKPALRPPFHELQAHYAAAACAIDIFLSDAQPLGVHADLPAA
jgi:hypothetical protein